MKLPTLTISAFVLSTTLISGTAFAQSQPGNLVVLSGAKSCVVLGEQVFNCHYQPRVFPKIIPPTFPPPTHRNPFSEIGNEGGGDRGGERGGGGGGGGGQGGQGSTGARP